MTTNTDPNSFQDIIMNNNNFINIKYIQTNTNKLSLIFILSKFESKRVQKLVYETFK